MFDEVDDIVNGWYFFFNDVIDVNVLIKRKRIRDEIKFIVSGYYS